MAKRSQMGVWGLAAGLALAVGSLVVDLAANRPRTRAHRALDETAPAGPPPVTETAAGDAAAPRVDAEERRQLAERLAAWRAKIAATEARAERLEALRAEAAYRGRHERSAALEAEIYETRKELEGYRELAAAPERRWRQLRSAEKEGEEGKGTAAPPAGLLRLAGLWEPYTLARVERVDRCASCHDPAGHPRPELFLGEGSPHPFASFGCAVCHGGAGRETRFWRAGHVPPTAAKAAAWRRRWGPREAAVLGEILPGHLAEAGCPACHRAEVWIAGSRTVGAGRELVARFGCAGCHQLDAPVPEGPPLDDLAAKTTRGWLERFLAAAPERRAGSFMPHLLAPAPGTVAGARRSTELAALVGYLWSRSEAPAPPPPPEGDASRGESLFSSLGCAGCHRLETAAPASREGPGHQGPGLAGAGAKLRPGWLYAWLRPAAAGGPEGHRPDLRLSDGEAADLTAFLLTLGEPPRDGPPVIDPPAIDPDERDALLREHLRAETTIEAAEARLEAMDARERELSLGERTLGRYACLGCHRLEGLDRPAPIGPPLAELATRPAGDAGRLRALLAGGAPGAGAAYHAYAMSERELEAVVSYLLSLRDDRVAPERRADLGARAAALADGRRLAERHGCRGCHRLEGAGGEAVPAPPLDGAGARLRSDWIVDYLRAPGSTMARPWLEARMPDFRLGRGELEAFARYFAALDGVALHLGEPPEPSRRRSALGDAVGALLQCGRCHVARGEAPPELAAEELAPAFRLARSRLRPDWVAAWVLDPQALVPGTAMPTSFPRGGDGRPDASFVATALEAPMFALTRARLLALYDGDEAALEADLTDARALAEALRAHLFTLAE